MIYPLVREMAADGAPTRVSVAVACGLLGFSEQAYYQWLTSPVSARDIEDAHLIEVLRGLHEDDPEGGYRVLADDLHDLGYRVSERRVWRLCRLAGIRSVITTRKRRYKKAGAPVHDDLVKRDFTAEGPNQLWLTDITEHWTGEGKLYCCAVKDVWSNRIVGYAIDKRMKARLAVNALEMAVTHRGNPTGVVVHSDRGSQFRSRKFVKALKRHELTGSMGRVGACVDNSAMEMLLSVSSGHRSGLKETEEVPGVVTLEAPHGLSLGLAFGDPAGNVLLGRLVVLRPREDHRVQCPVQLAIAAA